MVSAIVGPLAVLVFVSGLDAIEEFWFGRGLGSNTKWFLIGAGIASVPWGLWTVALMTDGSVFWRIGADAEEWTATELRQLGPLWEVEHSVPLPGRNHPVDIDHVAIGPYGVLVVETKWTSSTTDLSAPILNKDVRRAMRQVMGNAQELVKALGEPGMKVIPVVVYWGRAVIPPAEPRRREGDVRIVAGAKADQWRALLRGRRIDSEVVARFAAAVRSWRTEQEERAVGAARDEHLRSARNLSRVSLAGMGIFVALGLVTRSWGALDRILGWGGGAVPGVLLMLPLLVALLVLGVVHVARRIDPSVGWWRGSVPLLAWMGLFTLLILTT